MGIINLDIIYSMFVFVIFLAIKLIGSSLQTQWNNCSWCKVNKKAMFINAITINTSTSSIYAVIMWGKGT